LFAAGGTEFRLLTFDNLSPFFAALSPLLVYSFPVVTFCAGMR